MNNRRPLTRYSLDTESSRWWWPSAAAGAAATLAIVAIVASSAPSNAIPVPPDRYSTSTPTHSQDDIPPGFRQCFMWQTHWNDALNGPQPWCRLDRSR